jgi:hypothetical protein
MRIPREAVFAGVGLIVGLALGFGLSRASDVGLPALAWPTFAVDEEPVLVLIVGDRDRVDRVRRVVGAGRVVAESSGGFALRERRLIVAGVDEVGELLMSASWDDAPLDIMNAESLRGSPRVAESSDRDEKLAELLDKPTLNYAEAQLVLSLL